MKILILQIYALVKSWRTGKIDDLNFLDKFYKLSKESVVVSMSVIKDLLTRIEPDKSYKMMLHNLSINYVNNPYDKSIDVEGLQTVKAVTAIPGYGLKQLLSKCPELISDLINLMMEKISECRKINNFDHNKSTDIHSLIEMFALRTLVVIRAVYEIEIGVNTNSSSLTESATEENVSKYVINLDKCINDLREYYEKSDYSKILTPRKKTVSKMNEYMAGALDRKYKLNIPLYRIEDATVKTQDIVNNKIFPDMEKIVDKYPEFFIKKPTWNEEQDIYIYLTLTEPFGDKIDKYERKKSDPDDPYDKSKKNETINESVDTLTRKERNLLPDSEFGIPELRKFPINDETHIRSALRYFGSAKPKYKKQLATNISNKVKDLNLVGKIIIKPSNPYAKYFPKFMLSGEKSDTKSKFVNKSINECVTDEFGKLY